MPQVFCNFEQSFIDRAQSGIKAGHESPFFAIHVGIGGG